MGPFGKNHIPVSVTDSSKFCPYLLMDSCFRWKNYMHAAGKIHFGKGS